MIRFDGEVDISTAPLVSAALRQVGLRQPRQLVLDLRGLTFMDLRGARLLLAAERRARQGGYPLAVVTGPGIVRRLLRLVQLDDILYLREPAEVGLP